MPCINLKCFCGFSWVCSSRVSLLKFSRGFRMKRGAGSYTSLPDWQIIPAPLLCQTWDAESSVKELGKVLLCSSGGMLLVQGTELKSAVWFSVICSVFCVHSTAPHTHHCITGQPGHCTCCTAAWVCVTLHPEKHDGRVSPQPAEG